MSDNAPVKIVTDGCGTNEEPVLYILQSQC